MKARIVELEPGRTWVRPGGHLSLVIGVRSEVTAMSHLELELLDVARVVGARRIRARLAVGVTRVRTAVELPAAARHGYGLRVRVVVGGVAGSWRSTAVEAIDGWWEAPRHVAWTTFTDANDAPAQVAAARRWHVTVAQAYDWMYRHYRYLAPEEPFVDPLGRVVSHDAVRALVRAGHRAGIATLAYGSVYGAEPEYVADHPDERVFDDAGDPLSLGGAFYIQDLRPGSPWRARLLREYQRACRRVGFDGIHMDTYGPPHEATAADGARIRFADIYPGLVDEGAARVAATGHDRLVLFNCVEGFPLEAVARTPTAAHYLELWPPDDRYADVVAWIDRARSAGPGKAVVIAAYVPALREAGNDAAARSAAVETAALLTSVIHVAGAFHHVLAEHDRLLVEGYYPAAIALRAREARELRAAWTFGARYLHLLSDPVRRDLAIDGLELFDAAGAPVPLSSAPAARSVWARGAITPAGRVVSLVDLRDQSDDRWTAPRQAPASVRGWSLRWPGAATPVAMSPWSRDGDATAMRPAAASSWRLPSFRRWLVVHDPSERR